MSKGSVTIGLEIHIELKTRTKMFCGCLNDPDEAHPNTNICPVCTGHPGTLPVANKRAIECVLQLGMATGGTPFPKGRSKFDRKNYFYPDLPKGYQISQHDEPLVEGGMLNDIRIRRIHLEEDAGSLTHATGHSLVDFNRAGTALMELVTEPDIRNAEEAGKFAQELRRIVRYLDISDADMEKGLMRLEANISIDMGTKVEVKNINSFKALEAAIAYEYARQSEMIAKGEVIVQETRGWNEGKQATVSQRTKEDAHDYRYFPEPDMPPFDASAFDLERLKAEIPELPEAKRVRYMAEFGLGSTEADVLTEDRRAAEYFENAVSELLEKVGNAGGVKLLYNYFTSDLWGAMRQTNTSFASLRVKPVDFADLIAMAQKGALSSRGAKDALAIMVKTGASAETVTQEHNLLQTNDEGALEVAAKKMIAEFPDTVSDYRNGKTATINTLIGKAMKEMKGTGNPAALKTIFERLLA